MRLWCAFTLLVFTLSPGVVLSQSSNQIFEHLTTEQGLSSNKAEAVLQDRDGFYWIATQNGLNRFDGTSFTIFRHDSSDSTSLTNNNCTALVEDKNGDIWVATYKGVSRFLKAKGYFQPVYLHHPTRNFEITNRTYALATDDSGNIWIAGNGLWKYNVEMDSLILFENNKTDPTTIPFYSLVNQLVYDPELNGLWFITGYELVFYSIGQNQFIHQRHNPSGWTVFAQADSRELALDPLHRLWFRDQKTQALSYFVSAKNKVTLTGKKVDRGIKQICPDAKGRIWIFYWLAKAEIFNPETSGTDTSFFSIQHRRSVLSEQATSLFIDHQNNYWITSGHGISICQEGNQFCKLHQVHYDVSTPTQEPLKINALTQSDPEQVWLATNMGLFHYELATGKNQHIRLNLPIESVTTLLAEDGLLWIGVHDQLICMDHRSRTILKRMTLDPGIYFIRKGMDQDLWIGLWTGGVYRLNKKTGELRHFLKSTDHTRSLKSNSLITGMADGPTFWVGYNAGIGFSAYSPQTDAWSHYHPEGNHVSSSNAGTITVITKTDRDQLWLGTHGGGIFWFDPAGNQYTNYDQNQGLHSNYINSIVADHAGRLWISTADGMNYMDTEKGRIRSLNIDLVFTDNDFVANGIRGLQDKLYFFCNHEFVEIDPTLYKPDHAFPPLVISSFTIFDQEKALPQREQPIHLSYKENYFSFGYSAIKTHPSKKANYAHMLEGFNKDWITSTIPFASYTNVPDGNYLFKVRVTNDEGEWSEPLLNIPIHIKPPFWRTWWFIALCIGFVISAVYLFYRYRIQQIKKLFAIRTRISQDLHDDIGASLSSIHFNSSIAGQEVTDHPGKAMELLQQINQNSRQVIENISDIVWANQTGQPENSSLAGRIKNYGYDLLSPKNIECIYLIDAQAEKKLSNPEARRNVLLIIKEAMNNIAKYSRAEKAEVRVGLDGSHLLVDISDNGAGFNGSSTQMGNGLKNMKKRTDSLRGRFQIESSPGNGTRIHCSIPIPNISDR